EEVAFDLDAGAVDVAVRLAGARSVVDARQLDGNGRDLSARDAAAAKPDFEAVQATGRGERGAGAEPGEIELIDNGRVGIGDHVDDETIALFIGVDVVKGEQGLAGRGRDLAAAVLFHDMEPKSALGLPAVVPDEGFAGKFEVERAHGQGELDQHEVAFGHGEGVHIGGAVDRDLGDLVLYAAVAHAEQPVAAAKPELDHVVVVPLAR